MNILLFTCNVIFLFPCVISQSDKPRESLYDPIFGHRIGKTTSTETSICKERRYKFRKEHLQEIRNYKPEAHRLRDDFNLNEQLARRPLDPLSCRKEYVQSKNFTSKAIIPEDLLCDSQKPYGEAATNTLERLLEREKIAKEKQRENIAKEMEREKKYKEILEKILQREVKAEDSLERTIQRENKAKAAKREQEKNVKKEGDAVEKEERAMEEKLINNCYRHHSRKKARPDTTVHPMFRSRTTTGTTENSREIFTANSRILYEMESAQKKLYTGDSKHYQDLYEEAYKDVPWPEDKSISSDYSSFQRWYDDKMKNPNATTASYEWWTYDPNVTCETFDNGVPLDYNRVLYSLKMSSILPANISEELDARYDLPKYVDTVEANKMQKSMEEWGRTINQKLNPDAGPIPGRRELREPFEIMQNRYMDAEAILGQNIQKDVKNYVINPVKKGLYHFKHWMNKNYTTTTRRIALTWPEQDLNSNQMVGMYKKYLREEKNLTVRDSAGRSIFKKPQYQFTALSNYYCETEEDFPWAPKNLY